MAGCKLGAVTCTPTPSLSLLHCSPASKEGGGKLHKEQPMECSVEWPIHLRLTLHSPKSPLRADPSGQQVQGVLHQAVCPEGGTLSDHEDAQEAQLPGPGDSLPGGGAALQRPQDQGPGERGGHGGHPAAAQRRRGASNRGPQGGPPPTHHGPLYSHCRFDWVRGQERGGWEKGGGGCCCSEGGPVQERTDTLLKGMPSRSRREIRCPPAKPGGGRQKAGSDKMKLMHRFICR